MAALIAGAFVVADSSPAFAIEEGDSCSSEGLIVVEGGHTWRCQRKIGFGGTGLVWTCVSGGGVGGGVG